MSLLHPTYGMYFIPDLFDKTYVSREKRWIIEVTALFPHLNSVMVLLRIFLNHIRVQFCGTSLIMLHIQIGYYCVL